MRPGQSRRLESFFATAASAAAAELDDASHGTSLDAGELAERSLHAADAAVRLDRDERTRAHSALARWASADVEAAELPDVFRACAQLFSASARARREADVEADAAALRERSRRQGIARVQRIARARAASGATTIH